MGVVVVSVERGPFLRCLQRFHGRCDLAPEGAQLCGCFVVSRPFAGPRSDIVKLNMDSYRYPAKARQTNSTGGEPSVFQLNPKEEYATSGHELRQRRKLRHS